MPSLFRPSCRRLKPEDEKQMIGRPRSRNSFGFLDAHSRLRFNRQPEFTGHTNNVFGTCTGCELVCSFDEVFFGFPALRQMTLAHRTQSGGTAGEGFCLFNFFGNRTLM
jgi:hypothetical protein